MSKLFCDEYFMAKAITLAKKGWYTTDPNPRVGCVLAKDERIIAQGWHQYAGQGHAEVNALAQLRSETGSELSAQGATAYVTLEPCSHFGKTPPCSNALIAAGVKRVVVAMVDPNPVVSGNGIQRLRHQNIEVSIGVLESEARKLNPGFIQRMGAQRPRIRCKMAMSMDGRTAMASGESQWITSADAREDVQRLRAESSAILTGIGTVLADNPSMNVRSKNYTGYKRQPDRVILDSMLALPMDAKIIALEGKTVIFTAKNASTTEGSTLSIQKKCHALESLGAEVFHLAAKKQTDGFHLDLSDVVLALAKQQYNDVLLEAGATLTGAMLQAGYVDELIIYMAPHLMGSNARGLFNLPELNTMSQRVNLMIQDIRSVGKDFRIIASPQH